MLGNATTAQHAEIRTMRLARKGTGVSWTGKQADTMSTAMDLTYEEFAEQLEVAVRTVTYWHARPGCKIRDVRILQDLYDALTVAQQALVGGGDVPLAIITAATRLRVSVIEEEIKILQKELDGIKSIL
jgi:hypothetical protein